MDSLRDAIIKLKSSDGKFQTMLIQIKQSQEIKRFRHLKALVEMKFNGDGVPQHKEFRPDIVRRADAALNRISKQEDFGYDQAVYRIKNAWRNESCFRLAESILR
jgi:hypothetical protein